jgi:hypothetical protein
VLIKTPSPLSLSPRLRGEGIVEDCSPTVSVYWQSIPNGTRDLVPYKTKAIAQGWSGISASTSFVSRISDSCHPR